MTRGEALRLYWRLALTRTLDWITQAHCLPRLGGIARGRAIRQGGWRTVPYLLAVLGATGIVLVEQRRRSPHADPEMPPPR
jgi:hypothetical protein